MAKEILVINSDKVFFEDGAPCFYEWLCDSRGLLEAYQELQKMYAGGPQVLNEVFELATIGLTQVEFMRYIKEYTYKYKFEDITKTLQSLAKEYRIMIFSSYPRQLFDDLDKITEKIFGSEYMLDLWSEKIKGLSFIRLTQKQTGEAQNRDLPPFLQPLEKPKNYDKICSILDRLGLNKVYNRGSIEMGNHSEYVDYIRCCRWLYIEPDEYGMLVYLIDEMIEGGYERENIIVVNNSSTAQPIHSLAGRKISELDELN